MDDIFKENFLAFYAEVGDPPKNIASYSIDRIDAGKGYTKGNLAGLHRNSNQETGKMSNNTSGTTGVSWDNKTGLTDQRNCTQKPNGRFTRKSVNNVMVQKIVFC